ncbi:DUF11 domain-containing protein [Kitasatospora cheerisanensis]|uniref:DUF11 domain-containing protein n=1 Tax=Kitasatospora cheerisanensis TaxID=81942 RepID=UPI0012EDD5DD|nr:DUF11 domain-containing protein [Kitasatospora cheerisanensis]
MTYDLSVAQQGPDDAMGAGITGDLSQLLDDAAYNGDVTATHGTAEVKDGKLTWTGDLIVGASVTVRFSVTVTGNGDGRLHSAVTINDPGRRGSCRAESSCETDLTVQTAITPTPTPTPTATPTATATPGPTPTATGGGRAPGGNPGPAAPAPQGSGFLASTGGDVLAPAAIGLALLVAGGLTVALTRRRGRRA